MENINVLYQVNGSNISDIYNSDVVITTGDDNLSANFTAKVNNTFGKNSDKFTIGDEIKIIADIGSTWPPENTIFNGIIENITYPSKGLTEYIRLSGRDYTARMMDRTVEPEVYTNLQAGSIVKDIIAKYTDDITTTNTDDSTTTISRIAFNQTNVYDAVKQLSELANYTFYVDTDKDLHFSSRSAMSSGYTFNSGNVLSANFKERRNTVFNEVWIYGDRYLDGFKEEFTAGSPLGGSVFTLLYKPSNTIVNVGSPITLATSQVGAIANITSTQTSGANYTVNYFDKEITFISGTDIGYNSIPSSGALVTVDYQRELPIVKVGRNADSVAKYGKRIKKVIDKSIKDPDTAQERLVRELDENSTPKKEGTIKTRSIIDITPSQTAIVNLPNQNVNSKTYDILEAQYNFEKKKNITENVLTIKLNKKLDDITDTIKNLRRDVDSIQSADISDSDSLTRFETSTGSAGIRHSGVEVYSRAINDSFIAGHPINGVVGLVNPSTVGSIISGNSWVSGNIGTGYDKAINFNGSQINNIYIGTNNPMTLGSNSTFAGWFRLDKEMGIGAHNYRPGIAASGVNVFDDFITFDENNGNGYLIQYEDENGGGRKSGSFAYTIGSWIHLAITMDSNIAPNFYVDGNLNNGFVNASAKVNLNTIGTGYGGATLDGAFDGDIDEIRFYDKELSASEIGSLYAKKNYPLDRLTHYYKFDEGVGSFAYNSASVEMPTSDSIAYWRFNKSGTIFNDETGNFPATTFSGVELQAGVYGNGSALAFGSPAYCTYPSLGFGPGSPLSLTGWLQLGSDGFNAYNSQPVILSNYLILTVRNDTNQINFRYDNAGARIVAYQLGTGDRDWHHFAGIFDGGSSTSLYVDGILRDSDVHTAVPAVDYNNYIGRFGAEFFSGLTDGLRIYDRAISSSEVGSLYEGKTIQPLLGDRRTGSILEYSGGYPNV